MSEKPEEVWEPHLEPEPEPRPEPEVEAPATAHEMPVFAPPALPAAARPVRAFGASLPVSVLLIFIALTCINGLVAFLTLRTSQTMHNSVLDAGRQISETALEIRGHTADQAREIADLRTPIAPIDPEQHPTFNRARKEIVEGRYRDARRSIYSLLAVVDRLDAPQRQVVESRAHFLLAEAMHLEAVKRLEEER